jgi:prepilin-type N-terminal cleavage/methylation domain-containing protein
MKRGDGFTLIEVLAVVLLTGIVVGVALDFYLDLSRAGNRAADVTRGARRAAAVLERIQRDLESAVYLHKPDSVDPLLHPWIFLAESRGSDLGADRVKFVTRSHDPRRSAVPESDLAVVSYSLRRGSEGGLEIWRSEVPGLPEGLDREFPAAGSAGDALLVEGVAAFGMTFAGEDLQPQTSWDSSTLVNGNELPLLVDVRLAMSEPGSETPIEELPLWQRRVRLGVRPFDLEAMFAGAADANAARAGARTVCDCVDCKAIAATPSGARLVQAIGKRPAAQGLRLLPASLRGHVNPECQ